MDHKFKLNEPAIFDCEKDGYPRCKVVGSCGMLLAVVFDKTPELGAVPVCPDSLIPFHLFGRYESDGAWFDIDQLAGRCPT